MKSVLRSLTAAAALLLAAVSVPAQEGNLPLSDGTIKKIDVASGKVTITHGPIANLNMPPMTMSFKAKTPKILANWKEGDKVRFRSAEVDGVLTLISLEAAK